MKSSKEKFNKRLLVEGNDDQHVIWALCEQHHIPEIFDVIDCKGINKLIRQIPVRLKESGLETIGLIVDADKNLNERWESLKGILKQSGYDVTEELPKSGLIISNVPIKTGVWIMPDNNTNGMLENFIFSLVPKSKAKIHTWLAWQENPGTPMG